ncbi:MAG TPA: hypothetical protein PKW90_30040, partial [Myxococcota bacterium]|nr:hypothetical protein [Myxococcota bacterium]
GRGEGEKGRGKREEGRDKREGGGGRREEVGMLSAEPERSAAMNKCRVACMKRLLQGVNANGQSVGGKLLPVNATSVGVFVIRRTVMVTSGCVNGSWRSVFVVCCGVLVCSNA